MGCLQLSLTAIWWAVAASSRRSAPGPPVAYSYSFGPLSACLLESLPSWGRAPSAHLAFGHLPGSTRDSSSLARSPPGTTRVKGAWVWAPAHPFLRAFGVRSSGYSSLGARTAVLLRLFSSGHFYAQALAYSTPLGLPGFVPSRIFLPLPVLYAQVPFSGGVAGCPSAGLLALSRPPTLGGRSGFVCEPPLCAPPFGLGGHSPGKIA